MADAPSGRDYRETLFLPDTPFPMKAGLPQKEPERVKHWAEIGLYELLRDDARRAAEIRAARRPALRERRHPYRARGKQDPEGLRRPHPADGRASIATMCRAGIATACRSNGRSRRISAKQGRKKQDVPAVEFRKACRAYADKWIPLQREEFQRLGIEGDWDHYYTTMSFEAEAAIAREFLRVVRTGLVYRGSKPVMWSPVERTSLGGSGGGVSGEDEPDDLGEVSV